MGDCSSDGAACLPWVTAEVAAWPSSACIRPRSRSAASACSACRRSRRSRPLELRLQLGVHPPPLPLSMLGLPPQPPQPPALQLGVHPPPLPLSSLGLLGLPPQPPQPPHSPARARRPPLTTRRSSGVPSSGDALGGGGKRVPTGAQFSHGCVLLCTFLLPLVRVPSSPRACAEFFTCLRLCVLGHSGRPMYTQVGRGTLRYTTHGPVVRTSM